MVGFWEGIGRLVGLLEWAGDVDGDGGGEAESSDGCVEEAQERRSAATAAFSFTKVEGWGVVVAVGLVVGVGC